MNTLIILAALIACAVARPEGSVQVTQDTAGNYHLSYDLKDAKRSETGSADGTAIGSYEFTDKDGKLHEIKFTVGADGGYRAQGDLPTPVVDTPAVAAVRAAHKAEDTKQRSLLPQLVE